MAIIPARGQSKRIPHKNIIDLNGTPLIGYTITAALKSKYIQRVIVTTDDERIAEISKTYGAEVQYPRPTELSGDHDNLENVLKYMVKSYAVDFNADVLVLLQPTSPFRKTLHVDQAIELFINSGADTVTAVQKVSEHPYFMWKIYDGQLMPFYSLEDQKSSRHQLPQFFIENGSIYIVKKETLLKDGIYGKKVIPFEMNHFDSVDIDEPIDVEWAKFLLNYSPKK